jgi:hypothetical protein
MSMIAALRTAATTNGYIVHSTWQEKIGSNELVIVIDDVSLEPIETSHTYYSDVWATIEWETSDGDSIPTQVATLVDNIEEEIHEGSEPNKATFKFIQSEATRFGIRYRVVVTVGWRDLISI